MNNGQDYSDWQVRVEKKLTLIDERLKMMYTNFPICEKNAIKKSVHRNFVLIGIIFTTLLSLTSAVIIKFI